MDNRRSFFKGLATFVSGVAAAKVATYIPKKEEKKETVFVPSTLTIHYEGKEFHPLVVEKTEKDKPEFKFAEVRGGTTFTVQQQKATIREANI